MIRSTLDLRNDLFRSKNLEAEKLPPTLGTFFPHVLRCNYVSMRDKSYTTAHPNLPSLDVSGWEQTSGKHICIEHPVNSQAMLATTES